MNGSAVSTICINKHRVKLADKPQFNKSSGNFSRFLPGVTWLWFPNVKQIQTITAVPLTGELKGPDSTIWYYKFVDNLLNQRENQSVVHGNTIIVQISKLVPRHEFDESHHLECISSVSRPVRNSTEVSCQCVGGNRSRICDRRNSAIRLPSTASDSRLPWKMSDNFTLPNWAESYLIDIKDSRILSLSKGFSHRYWKRLFPCQIFFPRGCASFCVGQYIKTG